MSTSNYRSAAAAQPAVQTPSPDIFRKTPVLIMAAGGADSVPPALRRQLEQTGTIRYCRNLEPLKPTAFIALAKPYEYLALTRRAIDRLDASVLDRLPNLKGLSVYSTGLEWIDLDCLRKRGIRLASLPGYCTNAVAESALGLVLLTAHRLHLRYLKTAGYIPQHISLRGFELSDATVGIIGFGRIGRLLAEKAIPLCRRVLANDCDASRFSIPVPGVIRASKEEILEASTFVVICASQRFHPQRLLNDADYRLLHPDSVLINVGRTSLLDHSRLLDMVRRKQIHSYIYDDLMSPGDRPDEVEYGKIIPTGHTAWYSDQAMQYGSEQWIQNLLQLCRIR